MSEIIPNLNDGFSPENVERIYRGQPARVGGRVPADVISPREFEALSYVTDGLSYKQIAGEMGLGFETVKDYVHGGLDCLGILARSQLAGYFPIDPQDTLLKGKTLGDLKGRHQNRYAGLDILQALSVGAHSKSIAAERRSAVSTIRTQVHDISKVWTDARGSLRLAVVANGIRARYVQAMEAGSSLVEMEEIGEPTLERLVEVEPVILRDLAQYNRYAGLKATYGLDTWGLPFI